MRLPFPALVALLLAVPAAAHAAEPVRVLAAFTLKPALDQIAADYKKNGAEVMLIYGPSPGLAEQIENGLAADLFFSADPMWTDELAQHDLFKNEPVTDLIGNHLVLITRKGATLSGPPESKEALAGAATVGPWAMCDPGSHPAGRMAKASLTSLGLWSKVAAKVVRAENPLLAVKMVARGEAPYAVVFTSDALTDPGVEIAFTFPDDSHPPIRYPLALLGKSSNPEAGRFLEYLKSPPASAIFKRFGYEVMAGK
jgi:molybdate transport system substrate-binding protein